MVIVKSTQSTKYLSIPHKDYIGSLFSGNGNDFTDFSCHNMTCNYFHEISPILGELQLHMTPFNKTINSELEIVVGAMGILTNLVSTRLFHSYFDDILKSSIIYE